ncbi:DUF362 domain-containing protein [Halorubrum ezzemoulense]|uniref:DUF362 domain-containing protein n=1 Tax=Halorubrum ezzemoulense TaxID=337243 RepID=UPI002330FC29|nr:DUF362 domain-containing protein [Halorubrum ezzemoulense]MDB9248418.1 DUF362 domain-containing protein [Halorubrum ezzemoulense]MDB9259244.1 DUF362 domain-containing protein [Halorubrum ezzemoulense]MDB9262177.1 DUF362 domain-containing protein [Halorubrum ezzemoulense]MDB9266263.1 DUF362 domain-containing protein [Halorubrum ezzemoulense]MDB9269605.1 DUF362 domain-containing protein [Halorubrum ezzemoulense]
MEFPDRSEVDGLIDPQPLPEFARVRYEPRAERLDGVAETAHKELDELALDGLDSGATVAVGVGSRGIDRIDEVAAAVVERIAERGFEPVVVPAMGSHGGATPEGQREVLAALGVTEERVGAPIDARMGAERLATAGVGDADLPVYFSEAALAADAVVVVNRVKAHTNFTGEIESGLTKMTVVGLGKQRGAKSFHSTALAEGYVETLTAALDVIEEETPLVGGIALVENFEEEIGHLEAVPAGSFLAREPELLERANDEMPTLPVDDVDLLVVDEIGKEISGAGMDTNVIGRYRVLNASDPETPDVDLIYVRGLTEATKGNGNGIGLADLTRRSAVDQLDLKKSYANALTSGSLAKSKLPVVAPDDEFGLRTAAAALGAYDPETARIVWIRNTQDLGEYRVSDAVVDDLPEGADVVGRETVAFEDGTARFEAAGGDASGA